MGALKSLTSDGWIDTGSPVASKAGNEYHAYEKGNKLIIVLVQKLR